MVRASVVKDVRAHCYCASLVRTLFIGHVTPDFFYVFYLILSFSTVSQSFKKICVWEVFGRERP